MKTTRTIKLSEPRRFALRLFLITAILWTAGLFVAACDKHQKIADRHDEILRQEGD